VSSGRPPRKLAITGLGTFVGGRIAERLLEADDGPRVIALDLDLPRRLEGRLPLHRVDLTEPTADSVVAEILAKERCDALLHAAYFTDPHPDIEYAHELEMIGSLHVMNATAAAGVPKLVVSSTAQVYGARPDNPNFLDEGHPLRPHESAHQVCDRAEVESLLELFAERHPKQCVTSLRPCWVLGPTIESGISRFFEASRLFVPLGYDPLMQILHEEDLLRAVELALELDVPGPINLAGRGVLPLSTLVSLAGKSRWRLPPPLLYRLTSIDWLRRTGDPPEAFYDYLRYLWTVDTRRAKEQLGFEPQHTTKEAWMSFVVSRRLRKYR
jgi:UDP-glucose 4-epimerase